MGWLLFSSFAGDGCGNSCRPLVQANMRKSCARFSARGLTTILPMLYGFFLVVNQGGGRGYGPEAPHRIYAAEG